MIELFISDSEEEIIVDTLRREWCSRFVRGDDYVPTPEDIKKAFTRWLEWLMGEVRDNTYDEIFLRPRYADSFHSIISEIESEKSSTEFT